MQMIEPTSYLYEPILYCLGLSYEYDYYVVTDSHTAVLSSVDSKTEMFLFKTAPDMVTHTDTNPSASVTA